VIIRSLRADAFMRYERLELVDLPTGVIGIVGDNEAGKTTIGEAIAFAIFGRTIRTENTDPSQAIHWEHDVCRTSIEVDLPRHGTHRIERLVGRRGEFEAKVVGPGGEVLAEGPRAAAEALSRLLGFDFSTFRYSFYVAQHELDLIQRESKDNARRIVCDMLGITTVERAAGHLGERAAELSERADTLDRDAIVARALYTEALPIRDELEGHARRVEAADAHRAEAVEAELQTRQAAERAAVALDAGQERLVALNRLEGALIASLERRELVRADARLAALGAKAGGLAATAEEVTGAAAARDAAQAELEAAEGIGRAAGRLEALTAARADALERELDAGAADGLPKRIERTQARLDEAVGRAKRRLIGAIVVLLLGLAAGGLSAVTRLPEGEPAWTFAERRLELPQAGLDVVMTPERATIPLGILGGAAGLIFLALLWGRAGAARRRDETAAERARLGEQLEADRAELAACRGFEVGPLADVAPALGPAQDPGVRGALSALQEAAGEQMSARKTPKELVDAARAKDDALRAKLEQAAPRLAEARRLEGAVDAARAELAEVLGELYPDGVSEELKEGAADDVPADAEAIAADVQEVTARAVRARVELDALRAQGQAGSVDEARAAVTSAIERGLEAADADTAGLRKRYEDQSGLSELLRERDQTPPIADLRAVVRREVEVFEDVFGDVGALKARLAEARSRADAARAQLAAAKAEVEDLAARGQRLQAGRRRLQELEAKVSELQAVLGPLHRQLVVHREAIDLLGELADALRARFGPGVARYIELVLPALTNGRYRRARVDADLDIQLYSTERGDFVRLIELSLGTADQVLLALRLGLARALISSRGLRGGHFLFLDEPLASADETRERAFLDLLRAFDQEFAQIFVSSPRSVEEGHEVFTQVVHLSSDERVQRIEAGAGAS